MILRVNRPPPRTLSSSPRRPPFFALRPTSDLRFPPCPCRAKASRKGGFTLIELLVVMGIIAIAMAFLIPSLSPSSARSADAAAGQLKADLEQARLIAIAERTRTRVLLPTNTSDFSAPSSSPAPWPSDITWRGYLVVSEKRTDPVWKQRGKWSRFPDGVTIRSVVMSSPTPAPTAALIDIGGTGAANYQFSGPFIEFLANGSCNLDATATSGTAVIGDGFVGSTGTLTTKNQNLRFTVSVDPLTGSVSVQ